MKRLNITNGFERMSDPELETRAYQIIAAMTANPNFPAPEPAVPAMNALAASFFNALSECKDGDRLKIAAKNQVRDTLIDALHQLAAYVLFASNGDEVIAKSSSFSIGKTPSSVPPVTKPENFRIDNGSNPGELIGKVNRDKKAILYMFQYCTDAMLAAGNWQSVPSSKTTCILPNLQPGTKYNCRVAAIGAKDQIMYGDIITRIVA